MGKDYGYADILISSSKDRCFRRCVDKCWDKNSNTEEIAECRKKCVEYYYPKKE